MPSSYYLIALTALLLALYFSKEIREEGMNLLTQSQSQQSQSQQSQQSHSPAPRALTALYSRDSIAETKHVVKQDEAIQEMIQARLTQKGLKDMTESGTYQSDFSAAM